MAVCMIFRNAIRWDGHLSYSIRPGSLTTGVGSPSRLHFNNKAVAYTVAELLACSVNSNNNNNE